MRGLIAARTAVAAIDAETKSLVDEGDGECAWQSDPEYDRKASDLVFRGHSLADQLLARERAVILF